MTVRIVREPFGTAQKVRVFVVAPPPIVEDYPDIDAAIAALPPNDPAQEALRHLKSRQVVVTPVVAEPVAAESMFAATTRFLAEMVGLK